MSSLDSAIYDALLTAVHQSESGELHGDIDFFADVVAHEYDAVTPDRFKDYLLMRGLEWLVSGTELEFFRSMSGELNVVDKATLILDD
ncbi:hypothetical protein ACUTAF_19590 [Pseudomonas sp. SP16.1]|uniref:hypothetical protein n=1 Tax=Pseudomonas sp. SP16.1 TaxID=3458854 RepID=UPI004046708B